MDSSAVAIGYMHPLQQEMNPADQQSYYNHPIPHHQNSNYEPPPPSGNFYNAPQQHYQGFAGGTLDQQQQQQQQHYQGNYYQSIQSSWGQQQQPPPPQQQQQYNNYYPPTTNWHQQQQQRPVTVSPQHHLQQQQQHPPPVDPSSRVQGVQGPNPRVQVVQPPVQGPALENLTRFVGQGQSAFIQHHQQQQQIQQQQQQQLPVQAQPTTLPPHQFAKNTLLASSIPAVSPSQNHTKPLASAPTTTTPSPPAQSPSALRAPSVPPPISIPTPIPVLKHSETNGINGDSAGHLKSDSDKSLSDKNSVQNNMFPAHPQGVARTKASMRKLLEQMEQQKKDPPSDATTPNPSTSGSPSEGKKGKEKVEKKGPTPKKRGRGSRKGLEDEEAALVLLDLHKEPEVGSPRSSRKSTTASPLVSPQGGGGSEEKGVRESPRKSPSRSAKLQAAQALAPPPPPPAPEGLGRGSKRKRSGEAVAKAEEASKAAVETPPEPPVKPKPKKKSTGGRNYVKKALRSPSGARLGRPPKEPDEPNQSQPIVVPTPKSHKKSPPTKRKLPPAQASPKTTPKKGKFELIKEEEVSEPKSPSLLASYSQGGVEVDPIPPPPPPPAKKSHKKKGTAPPKSKGKGGTGAKEPPSILSTPLEDTTISGAPSGEKKGKSHKVKPKGKAAAESTAPPPPPKRSHKKKQPTPLEKASPTASQVESSGSTTPRQGVINVDGEEEEDLMALASEVGHENKITLFYEVDQAPAPANLPETVTGGSGEVKTKPPSKKKKTKGPFITVGKKNYKKKSPQPPSKSHKKKKVDVPNETSEAGGAPQPPPPKRSHKKKVPPPPVPISGSLEPGEIENKGEELLDLPDQEMGQTLEIPKVVPPPKVSHKAKGKSPGKGKKKVEVPSRSSPRATPSIEVKGGGGEGEVKPQPVVKKSHKKKVPPPPPATTEGTTEGEGLLPPPPPLPVKKSHKKKPPGSIPAKANKIDREDIERAIAHASGGKIEEKIEGKTFSFSPKSKKKQQPKKEVSPESKAPKKKRMPPGDEVVVTEADEEALNSRKLKNPLFPLDIYGENAVFNQNRSPTVTAYGPPIQVSGKSSKSKSKDKDKLSPYIKVYNGRAKFYNNGGPGEYPVDEINKAEEKLPREKPPTEFDESVPWLCCFCGKKPHEQRLGDLFGPYYTQTKVRVGKKMVPTGPPKETWMHEHCAIWAPNVLLIGNSLRGLEAALETSEKTKCSICDEIGATIGCLKRKCTKAAHFPCAKLSKWRLDFESFHSYCAAH